MITKINFGGSQQTHAIGARHRVTMINIGQAGAKGADGQPGSAGTLLLNGNVLSLQGGSAVALPITAAGAQNGSIPQFNMATGLYEPTLSPDLVLMDGGNF